MAEELEELSEGPSETPSDKPSESSNVIVLESGDEPKKPKLSKKQLVILAGLLAAVVILGILLFVLLRKEPEELVLPKPKLEVAPISIQAYDSQKIDMMVAKANALYENGSKDEALKIYENIAKYNEGISNYNLGVSRMKQGDYKAALEAFNKSLNNNENSATSALNAAVCALYLGDDEKFSHFIDLAYTYLENEHSSSLYNYYLGLINYYKGFYHEALQALSKPINPLYEEDAAYLRAKILSYFGDNQAAVNTLNSQYKYEKLLELGLLNARLGNYEKAKYYLNECLERKINTNLTRYALMLVSIKLGEYQEAASLLRSLEPDFIKSINQVRTVIDDRLFDINYAQRIFERNYLLDKTQQYNVIFYYTPFIIFDPKDASSMINQANTNAFMSDHKKAEMFLSKARKLSGVNAELARAIALALNYDLEGASKILENLVDKYNQHAILHYDLALSYALLGKFDRAKKHFLISFHLDAKNYRSGIYALYCADILQEDTTKLEQDITDSIRHLKGAQMNTALALLALKRKDYIKLNTFLQQENELSLQNLSLEIIALNLLADQENLEKKTKLLIDISGDDILANMLYFSLKNSDKNIKSYARDVQTYFLNRELDYRSLFGGAQIVSRNYVRLMQISGLIAKEREKLKEYLRVSSDIGALKALAYLDIYANEFEESFSIYNSLIDDYDVQDSRTLFLASVAAIGGGHKNSAIALLELSRVKSIVNLEARLALGFLYLESNNFEAAAAALEKTNNGYKSEFFTFDLDNRD